MKKLALIGSDVSRSLSPLLFKFFYKIGGEECEYSALSIDEKASDELLLNTIKSFDGVNITSPFKFAAARILGQKGSVNTVVNTPQGRVCASTDGMGLVLALRSFGISVKGAKMLVLGTGGAAYSACEALSVEGALIRLKGRDKSKEKAIIKELNLASFKGKAQGILSFIPPQSQLELVSEKEILSSGFVFDASYKEESELLKYARLHNISAIDGLPMLYFQGLKAYELFFNKEFVDAKYRYREFLNEVISNKRR